MSDLASTPSSTHTPIHANGHTDNHTNGSLNNTAIHPGNGLENGHANDRSSTGHSSGDTEASTYIDPAADASLISIDGRVFKVQSYILKAHSTVLRDQLAASNGAPIKVPASKRVIKAYLDLAHFHNRPPKWIWSVRAPLLALCDELGSPSVSERALFAMHSCVEKDPWEVFSLASQRNNVGLAKSALKALGDKQVIGSVDSVSSITPSLAAPVTLPYLLGLFAAALQIKRTNELDEDNEGAENWQAIAEAFGPISG